MKKDELFFRDLRCKKFDLLISEALQYLFGHLEHRMFSSLFSQKFVPVLGIEYKSNKC